MSKLQLDMFVPKYPATPGHAGVDTSIAAADSVKGIAAGIRGRIEKRIAERGNATCDEIEVEMKLSHQTASARIRELVMMQRIRVTVLRRTTRSGRSARVYERNI